MARKPKNLTLSADDYSVWKRRIEDGEERVTKMRENTKVYREAFHGRFPTPYPEEDDGEQVTVNRVHRVCLQWIGAMYAQNPRVTLRAPWRQGAQKDELAKQEAIINTEMSRIGLQSPLQRAIQSAFLDGWAWIKSGFHAEFENEAAELEELTTDVDAENLGFDLGEEQYPKAVLINENHEEHLAGHAKKREAYQTKANEIRQIIQKTAEQAQQQGVDPKMVVDQTLTEEMLRCLKTAQAMEEHEKQHKVMARRRDEEGANVTNSRIVSESCWSDYVHNSCVVWDQHATGPHDWRWVAEKVIKPVEEFRKIPRFKFKDQIEANFSGPKPGSVGDGEGDEGFGGGVKSEMLDGAISGDDDPDSLAEVWKIWDIEHRRIIWYHEKADEPLLVDEWPHKHLKTAPLRMLYFELREDEFFPISQVTYFWDQQLEINRYRTKAGIVARRLNRQALASPGVPDELISAMSEGKDGAIHKLSGGGLQPKDAIHVIDWGRVPSDWYSLPGQAENDIQIDTGLGETALGSGVDAKTATAARVQQSSAGVTLDIKLSQIEELVAWVASDLRNLMRQYYKEARFVEFWWEGELKPSQWDGQTLGEFEIQVEFGSSKKQEQDMERMQWTQAIQLLSNFPFVNLEYLVREYLRRLGIRDTSEAMKDLAIQSPTPMQPGIGPGQGSGQQSAPGRVPGPPGAEQLPGMNDMTKP